MLGGEGSLLNMDLNWLANFAEVVRLDVLSFVSLSIRTDEFGRTSSEEVGLLMLNVYSVKDSESN